MHAHINIQISICYPIQILSPLKKKMQSKAISFYYQNTNKEKCFSFSLIPKEILVILVYFPIMYIKEKGKEEEGNCTMKLNTLTSSERKVFIM